MSVVPVFELAGLNDAVMPVGRPDAVNATAPENPPCGATVICTGMLPPGPMAPDSTNGPPSPFLQNSIASRVSTTLPVNAS